MNVNNIKNLGELKRSGYKPVSIKDEMRKNMIASLQNNSNPSKIGNLV